MKEILFPERIVKYSCSDHVVNLLKKQTLQIGFSEKCIATFFDGDYVILDFGKEMCGGIRILTYHSDKSNVRLRFGESLSECAAREIEEECGLSQLAVDEKLCSTLHIYNTYGRWELKRTTWFAVRALGSTATTPQADEDIALVEWCSLDEAVRRATNESYPTIAQVMYEYKNKL